MLEAAASGDIERFCDADYQFHTAIWQACGNESIQMVLGLIVPKIFAFDRIHKIHPSREKRLEVALLHGRLLDGIRARDPGAVEIMKQSMLQALSEDVDLADAAASKPNDE
ncbi:MAG: FCD domain-containing protein, partial [Acidobacteria bacterium]|nr:FCD domain-containing protein [Acidobacteriota bacterium]